MAFASFTTTSSATLALCSSLSTKCKISFLSLPPASSSSRPTFLSKFSDSAPAAPVLADEPATQVADVSREEPNSDEIFAVVMIGSRQYIVIPGQYIYIQRLKDAKVNDKLFMPSLKSELISGWHPLPSIFSSILYASPWGSRSVHQGLNDKVIVFKYEKKKNYRRNIGHRQPNTRIRIKSITGYEDFEATPNVET